MQFRDFTADDYEAAATLWQACGLHPSDADSPEAMAEVARLNPGLFLLAFEGELLAATIMGTWDGRRGWINRLAVTPAMRGRGLGQEMLELVETRLRERGCTKVNLLVEPDNHTVTAFYAAAGYTQDPLIFMEKWL